METLLLQYRQLEAGQLLRSCLIFGQNNVDMCMEVAFYVDIALNGQSAYFAINLLYHIIIGFIIILFVSGDTRGILDIKNYHHSSPRTMVSWSVG